MIAVYTVAGFIVGFLLTDILIEREFVDNLTIFYIIFCFLQFLDVVTTKAVLEKGGVELNPIMRWFFEKFGVEKGLIVSKLLIISIFGYLILMNLLHTYAIVILIAIYCWVVYNNYTQLKRMEDDS